MGKNTITIVRELIDGTEWVIRGVYTSTKKADDALEAKLKNNPELNTFDKFELPLDKWIEHVR